MQQIMNRLHLRRDRQELIELRLFFLVQILALSGEQPT